MSDRETIYATYLQGFVNMTVAGVTLPEAAAYALGARDRAASVEQHGGESDVPVVRTGPHLRSCGEVLEAVRQMVPQPQSVPADVDRMMLEGRALQQRVEQLSAEVAQATSLREADAADGVVRAKELESALEHLRQVHATLRGIVGADGEHEPTGQLLSLTARAVAAIGTKLGAGPTLTDIVAALQRNESPPLEPRPAPGPLRIGEDA